MSEINLYNLSLDELKEQARILGIVVRGNPGADTLREKIRNAVMIEPPADQKQAPKEDPDRKRMDHDSDRRGRARPAACLCRSEREVIFHTQGRASASTAGSGRGAEQCQANRVQWERWNQQNGSDLSIPNREVI